MDIYADQLIYARVEPALSPRRLAGFQTVYHSPQLTPAVVAEIQKLIGVFDFEDGARTTSQPVERLQYFRVDDGRIVLSRAIPARHAEYIDCRNRPNTFICHCLILSLDEFRKIDNNPFVAFNHCDGFVDDAEELYERFVADKPTGDGRLAIPVSRPPAVEFDWPTDEVRELRRMALLAKSIVASGGSIVLWGDHDEIADVLQAVFELTPDRDIRLNCTFTTHADGCDVPSHKFWAIGLGKRPRREFRGEVDVAGRRVLRLPQGGAETRSSYYVRWLDVAMKEQSCGLIMQKAATIQELSTALEQGPKSVGDRHWDGDAVREFAKQFRGELSDRLARGLRWQFSAEAATACLNWLRDQHLTPTDFVCWSLSGVEQIAKSELAETAFRFLLDAALPQAVRLTRGDWSRLSKLAQDGGHDRLLFVSEALGPASLFDWGRKTRRRTALTRMDNSDYRELIRALHGVVEPAELVCQGKSQQLLDNFASWDLSDKRLVELLHALLQTEEPLTPPTGLLERLRRLPYGKAARLRERLEVYPCDAEPLEEALRRDPADRPIVALWNWLRESVT